MIKLSNEYIKGTGNTESTLRIDLEIENNSKTKISIYNNRGRINVLEKEYEKLHEAIYKIASGTEKLVELILDGRNVRIKRIINSDNTFILELFFNGEAFFYEIDFLSFIGDQKIDSKIVGFLNKSDEDEIDSIRDSINKINSLRHTCISLKITVEKY